MLRADSERSRGRSRVCLEILDGRDLDYPVAYDMERKGTFAGGRENTTAIAKAFVTRSPMPVTCR